jgi:predicted NBD/HSP70 family sugar kinase
MTQDTWYVVGLDNGGNKNNGTVLDPSGRFLIEQMIEMPSRVLEGAAVAVEALAEAFEGTLKHAGVERSQIRAVGLDSPGPASAEGVIASRGSTNFADPSWRCFDFRGALEKRLGLPVTYNNDGNAAALYAHYACYGDDAPQHSSISAIVGTGLGGGVIHSGQIVKGAVGFAGELGHVFIPMEGLLEDGQPVPRCNCGFDADVESVASLLAIEKSLLPYWLTRYEDHELAKVADIAQAAKQVRSYGEKGDPMARRIFEQQAIAIGRLFTIASRFMDPDAYFVGGGVAEAAPEFRDWYLEKVRENTRLDEEQAKAAKFALVPHLDMAGARGAALAALDSVRLKG